MALAIAAELDVVGVLAVELFETRDGHLLVNELAMRPHNTAHWTIDGAVTSQFENHLRAVLDLPLGSPATVAPFTVMVNVFGGDQPEVYSAYRHCLTNDPDLKIHWYGKAVRPGRKVGHVTATGDDVDDLRVAPGTPLATCRGTPMSDLVRAVGDGDPLVGIVMGSDSDWSVMSAPVQCSWTWEFRTRSAWCPRTGCRRRCSITVRPRLTVVCVSSSQVPGVRPICPACSRR